MSSPLYADAATAQFIGWAQAQPQLDKSAERELLRRYRATGDRAAAERVVSANLRHVVALALRYRRLSPSLSELIAQGNLGLLIALERFDPERDVRFATYANHWVRAEILGNVLASRALVGAGRGDLRARYAWRLTRDAARSASLHGGDGLAQLTERYGKSHEELSRVLAKQEQRDASLEAPISARSELTLHDCLAADASTSEELCAERERTPELAHEVARATADLSERERFIVQHRLMADPETQLSLSDIGKRFGVSRERARQLEARLKARLRERLTRVVAKHELLTAA